MDSNEDSVFLEDEIIDDFSDIDIGNILISDVESSNNEDLMMTMKYELDR